MWCVCRVFLVTQTLNVWICMVSIYLYDLGQFLFVQKFCFRRHQDLRSSFGSSSNTRSNRTFWWANWHLEIWVVVSNIFYFHPYLGKIPMLTNIFQRGWNHQLGHLEISWIFVVTFLGWCDLFRLFRRREESWDFNSLAIFRMHPSKKQVQTQSNSPLGWRVFLLILRVHV